MKTVLQDKILHFFEKRESVSFSLITQFDLPNDDYSAYLESAGSRYELELLFKQQFVKIISQYTAEQKLSFRCNLLNKKGVRHKYIIFRDCSNYISSGALYIQSIDIPLTTWNSFKAQYPTNFIDDLSLVNYKDKNATISIVHRKTTSETPSVPQIRCALLLLNFLYPLNDMTEEPLSIDTITSVVHTGKIL